MRRWLPPVRRGRILWAPPVLPPAPSPAVPAVVRRRPQVPSLLRRVGRFLGVPAAPGWAPAVQRPRPVAQLVARRGRFLPVPLAQPVVPPPVPMSVLRGGRRAWFPPRRGTFISPPWVQASPPSPQPIPAVLRRRLGLPVVRRSGRFGAVPASAMVPPPGLVRPEMRGRFPAPRARFVQPPWTPPAQTAPPPIPAVLRRQIRPVVPVRRGEFVAPPVQAQAVVVPPPLPQVRRPRPAVPVPVRRARFTLWASPVVPPAPPPPPAAVLRPVVRPVPAAAVRRGRLFVAPVAPVVAPAAWVPTVLRPRVRLHVVPRKGRLTPPVPLVVASPGVLRPGGHPAPFPGRRGRFLSVAPTPAPTPGSPVPSVRRRPPPRFLPVRVRGRFVQPILVGLAPPPPAFTPPLHAGTPIATGQYHAGPPTAVGQLHAGTITTA